MTPHRRACLSTVVVVLLSLACTTRLPAAPTTGRRPTDTASPEAAGTAISTAALMVAATPAAPQPTPVVDYSDLAPYREAMRPEYAGEVEAFAASTRYYVEAVFTPGDPGVLTGRQRVRYTNHEAVPLTDIFFHLYVNTEQFLGQVELGSAWVNGQPVLPELKFDGAAARLTFLSPLAPGDSVDMALEWRETVEFGTESGLYRWGATRGVYAMPTFVPLVARRLDGQWDVGELPFTGDPVSSDTALFWLRITAPENLAVVTGGAAIEAKYNGDGTQTVTFATGPMRDVALIVGPLEQTQLTEAGLTFNVWLLDQHADQAQAMLTQAEASVAIYSQVIGPYPYDEIDYVDIPGFGGIEYPGLVIIGTVGDSSYQEVVVAHETGHQWFYGLIGDDQVRQPWLDEGVTSYLEVVYYRAVHGHTAGQSALDDHIEAWQRGAEHPDLPVGLAVNDYPSEAEYFTVVYDKSVAFLEVLRRTMGQAAFSDFLPALYSQYKYGFVTTAEFESLAEFTCTCKLDDLFTLWVIEGGPVTVSGTPPPTP